MHHEMEQHACVHVVKGGARLGSTDAIVDAFENEHPNCPCCGSRSNSWQTEISAAPSCIAVEVLRDEYVNGRNQFNFSYVRVDEMVQFAGEIYSLVSAVEFMGTPGVGTAHYFAWLAFEGALAGCGRLRLGASCRGYDFELCQMRLLRAHGDRHHGPVGALDPSKGILDATVTFDRSNDASDATVTFDPSNDASDATVAFDPGNDATAALPRRNATDAPRLTDAPRPRLADASRRFPRRHARRSHR